MIHKNKTGYYIKIIISGKLFIVRIRENKLYHGPNLHVQF
jgi:hypothetical protein